MTIQDKLSRVLNNLHEGVALVAVSKRHPASAVQEAYEAGQRDFGESRVQELVSKREELPEDIRWHFIGHLQTNKVKQIAPFIAMVHSIDSYKLLAEVSSRAIENHRCIDCLLQLHVAAEDTKFGMTPEECIEMLELGDWRSLDGVRICGIMCMATNTDDEQRIVSDFERAKETFELIKRRFFAAEPSFAVRSWGMSGDYALAVQHGANMVRIGSALFSEE